MGASSPSSQTRVQTKEMSEKNYRGYTINIYEGDDVEEMIAYLVKKIREDQANLKKDKKDK